MEKVPLCVVGCGGMGHRHIMAYRVLEDSGIGNIELVAVCDVRPENAAFGSREVERLFGRKPMVFTDLGQVLARGICRPLSAGRFACISRRKMPPASMPTEWERQSADLRLAQEKLRSTTVEQAGIRAFFRRSANVFITALFLSLLAAFTAAQAHSNANGSGYYALEWPSDVVFAADGQDGDWAWFNPEFAVGSPEMTEVLEGDLLPAADLHIHIRTAWTQPPDNRLLGFVRVFDDTLNIDEIDLERAWYDDELEIVPDADHSGTPSSGDQNVQEFSMHVRVPGGYETPHALGNFTTWLRYKVAPEKQWSTALIEAAIGLTPVDAGHLSPQVTVDYEFAMPLWPTVEEDPADSRRHMLEPGQIIGLTYQINDADSGDRTHQLSTAGVIGAAWSEEFGSDYTLLTIGEYTRADGGTAVRRDSWARIKTHLKKWINARSGSSR